MISSKLPMPLSAVKDAGRPIPSYRHERQATLKKYLPWILKLGFSAAVLAILAWHARSDFPKFVEYDKNWTLLAAGWFALVAALMTQFCRWRLLARALGLKLSIAEAMRLGFMGQLFSLLGVGMLGGDALKTYFLGRQNPGRMTEALTSVFVDRVIGLYALVVMAGIVCLVFDPTSIATSDEAAGAIVQTLCRLAPWAALASSIGLGIMLLPGVTTWAAWDALAGIPKVGRLFEKLVRSMRLYRRSPGYLFGAIGLTLGIHSLNCLVFYAVSLALPAVATIEGVAITVAKPSLAAHAAATLLALSTGALPVGGLELVFNYIFRGVSPPNMPATQGFMIVIAYRVLQLGIALIGLYYYLAGRREVQQLMEEEGAKE
jgi:glycosyltransferase 2 family protein